MAIGSLSTSPSTSVILAPPCPSPSLTERTPRISREASQHWRDAIDRIQLAESDEPNSGSPVGSGGVDLESLVRTAALAKKLIGTADEQLVPGVREYLFPKPVTALKGSGVARKLVFGERGLFKGLSEIFIDKHVGAGFAKMLSSVVFFPFVAVAMVVDSPRFLGDHIIKKANQVVLKGVIKRGVYGALFTMAGGLMRTFGGVIRVGVPIAAVCLGVFVGGVPGVAAAILFETVYFGEDLAHLTNGEFEEMTLFRGLQDIVGGLSIVFGSEFILKLNRRAVQSSWFHWCCGGSPGELSEPTPPE